MQYLLFTALVTEVILFTRYDKKVFGNYLSPLNILAYPLLVIIFLALFIAPELGFKPVSEEVLFLYLIGLPVFWMGSLFWSVIIPKEQIHKAALFFENGGKQTNFPLKKIMLALSWFIISVMTFSFITALKKYGSISAIGTEEFVYDYSGYGFKGHTLVLGIFALIYIIGMVKKFDYFTIITMLILVVLLLLQQVKTWLYVPLLGGMILRFHNHRSIRVNPVFIIIGALAAVLLFFLSYYFEAVHNQGDLGERFVEVIKHMTAYLFSGVLGFGEHINQGLAVGESPSHLVMAFRNMWSYIFGGEVYGVVSDYHLFIDNKDNVDVNVKTIFGTIFIYGGAWWGFIYVFAAGIILYFNWIMAGLTKNYWLTLLYAFLAAPLFIGWFDFYYNQLTFVELPVIIIIVMILNKVFTK